MARHQIKPAFASANERLHELAARAREADRLAEEAAADAGRLRKEMKRARKAYKEARQTAKDATKKSRRAQTELSECLNEAFRIMAMALQQETPPQSRPADTEAPAITRLHDPPDSGHQPPQSDTAAA